MEFGRGVELRAIPDSNISWNYDIMLNSEVLTTMMGRLGRRLATAMRSTCLSELTLAIQELERAPIKPWFLEETKTGTLVIDQDYIDLPTDFLMEIEEGTFEVRNTATGWQELTKVARDKLRSATANMASAFPKGYAIWGSKFYLGPTPDVAYSYRFDYYKRSNPIVDNSAECSNFWINEFFNYTTSKALIVIARDHIQSDRMAQNMQGMFNEAEKKFNIEITARKVANETMLLTDEES